MSPRPELVHVYSMRRGIVKGFISACCATTPYTTRPTFRLATDGKEVDESELDRDAVQIVIELPRERRVPALQQGPQGRVIVLGSQSR